MASEKITKIVEEVKTLTVMELSELVKAIEEEFGVSAAAPVMVAGPAAAAPAADATTWFWSSPALPRCPSSSWSRRSPAWA